MHCHNLRSKRPGFSFNDIQRLTCTDATVLNFEREWCAMQAPPASLREALRVAFEQGAFCGAIQLLF
jgi:hypothetical protein